MTEFQHIKVKVEDNVATLTLASPPVNALSPAVLKEIQQALDQFQQQKARAVIVTGSGTNAFCAGADVKAMRELETSPEKAAEFLMLGVETFSKVENFPAPVIAAVNNLCLGGGLELILACDIRISSDRARFGLPEVTLGLVPSWGGTARLPRVVGAGNAKELIYTGQLVNAQAALRIGLLNKVVPDGDEVRAALDIAKRVATKASPVAVKNAKVAINEGLNQDIETALAASDKVMGEVMTYKDLREGIQAFLEKRPPAFKGE
jgi:enoyl-CoA hydratase